MGKELTLLEAAKAALTMAEGLIRSDYEGTKQFAPLMRKLGPVRRAIAAAQPK